MPSAFISYSWENEEHKIWVRTLATRLRKDGVETILDQWHAIPGDQLPVFMERAARDSDYVLIICTPHYKDRTDSRIGGVGYEGDILTGEVLTTGNTRKFIPVLRNGPWPEAAPNWLSGKYYIDLRGEPYPTQHYNDLLTTLLGTRPQAPPVLTQEPQAPSSPEFEPIQISGIVLDEIGEPKIDGSPLLYAVPLRLSRRPPEEWIRFFIHAWDYPSSFTYRHRPGIASVIDDKVLLNGTTIQDVDIYHRHILIQAAHEANRQFQKIIPRPTHQKPLP